MKNNPSPEKYHISKWMLMIALALWILIGLTYKPVLAAKNRSLIPLALSNEPISAITLINQTNQVRAYYRLPLVTIDQELTKAAEQKAQDMALNNYFDHYRPKDHKSPWDFMDESGYKWQKAGENLARGFQASQQVIKAWLESPTHRSNLLNPEYTNIGIATLVGEKNSAPILLTVQMFGAK